MTHVSEPTPLGRLLKARRQKNRVSWKRLEQAVGVEDQTMMRWERGVTKDPPIGKVLLFAREVGISLEELEAAALATAQDAGVDRLGREARALRRRADALSADARDGDDPPSDEGEPQSGQAG